MRHHFKKWLKHHFHEIMKEKTSPDSIALGFAVGTFIAILPSPGLNLIMAFLAVLISERINRIAVFGALAFWNPIISIPLMYVSYKIGRIFIDPSPVQRFEWFWLNELYNYFRITFIGNVILSVVVGFLSYFIVLWAATAFQKRHHEKKS